MSEFEEVFGNKEHLEDLIAVIRDNIDWDIEKYIPDSSAAASPECVLYAIYKYIEEKEKKLSSF